LLLFCRVRIIPNQIAVADKEYFKK